MNAPIDPSAPASAPVPARVVVVDDDDIFRDLVMLNLKYWGYDAYGVPDAATLYRELLERPVDIVILDIGLPGEDGLAIASHLRGMRQTRTLGIIMLTSYADLSKRVAGLESGADVYLCKPVNWPELRAQLHSLYRRLTLANVHEGSKPWRFLQSARTLVTPSGTEVPLTHLEAQLIGILVDGEGKPVRRREIIASALQQDPLAYDERRLEAVVSRLRRKIARVYGISQPIKVAHAVGYVFSDPVTRGPG